MGALSEMKWLCQHKNDIVISLMDQELGYYKWKK